MAEPRINVREVKWVIFTLTGVLLFWTLYVYILFVTLTFPETRFLELWLDMIQEEEAIYVMIVSMASVYAVRFMITTVRLRKKLDKLTASSS